MKQVFLAASGAFAAIPGIGIIVSGLGTPPGYSKLFGGLLEAFGALAILLLVSGKAKIRRLSRRRATTAVLALALGSFCLLVLYLQLTGFCIVAHPTHGTVYYPLWLSGHLEQMVVRTGGRYAALDHYGAYPLIKAIQESPHYPLSMVVTTAILILVYQGVFGTMTVAFGILGLRSNKADVQLLESLAGASGNSGASP
jgi:hypothetical protein